MKRVPTLGTFFSVKCVCAALDRICRYRCNQVEKREKVRTNKSTQDKSKVERKPHIHPLQGERADLNSGTVGSLLSQGWQHPTTLAVTLLSTPVCARISPFSGLRTWAEGYTQLEHTYTVEHGVGTLQPPRELGKSTRDRGGVTAGGKRVASENWS